MARLKEQGATLGLALVATGSVKREFQGDKPATRLATGLNDEVADVIAKLLEEVRIED